MRHLSEDEDSARECWNHIGVVKHPPGKKEAHVERARASRFAGHIQLLKVLIPPVQPPPWFSTWSHVGALPLQSVMFLSDPKDVAFTSSLLAYREDVLNTFTLVLYGVGNNKSKTHPTGHCKQREPSSSL